MAVPTAGCDQALNSRAGSQNEALGVSKKELKPGCLPAQPSLWARSAPSQEIVLLPNRPRASHRQKVCSTLCVLQLPLKCSECRPLNWAQGLSERRERAASAQGSNAGC